MMNVRRQVGLAALALIISASNLPGQTQFKSKAVEINVTGRLHALWDYSSAAEELSSVFLIRRARITLEVKVNDFISGKIQPDFTTGFGLENGLRLKDAYIDMNFAPQFQIRMGQFKLPFDVFELISSTQILVIERTGIVRGADSCTGVGSVCSYSRFTESLGYSDRDVGIQIGGDIAGSFAWSASATNGEIFEDIVTFSSAIDTTEVFSEGKSFGGRLEYRGSDLRVGANAAGRDFANPVEQEVVDYAIAYGADLDWGSYTSGLHVQAGVTSGDNWKNLDDAGDPSTFVTTQGIVTYKIPVRNSRFLEAIEPLGRVSYADPDTDADDDHGLLFTPGIVAYFTGRNKVALNVDIYKPGDDRDAEYSVKVMSYLHF
ncbi:MAG: hypothetical protein JSU87_12480 [Gemmatimonadota bacterium]|nr:MAG: hypothetical protein JSU87_12480 [Gemmatimonadota bacterium]